MKTHSLNSLAESFEIDRSTMVRALKNVPGDAEVTRGRPTWKIATAAAALEQHRRNMGTETGTSRSNRNNSDGQINPQLAALYVKFDTADAAMRKLKTLGARRNAAIAMIPFISQVDALTRKWGLANGNDPDLVHLAADNLRLLYLRGFEQPCNWTMSETWDAMNV